MSPIIVSEVRDTMPVDGILMILALAAYTLGALALLGHFFSPGPQIETAGKFLAITGCAAQFAQIVARWQITHIWPLLNLYGSLSLFSATSVAIFIIFALRYKVWFAGGFVLALAALFLAYAVTWNEGAMPAVPSLQTYWAKVHVPLIVSSYSAFMVAFVMSGIYLIKYYGEAFLGVTRELVSAQTMRGGEAVLGSHSAMASVRATRAPAHLSTPNIELAAARGVTVAQWLNGMPSLSQIDLLVYRLISVGLTLLTVGVITGAMWAHDAWGAYWQWDPKETAALFSWIVYAAYMHLHTRNQWRGMRSAWISVVGFASIMFCYFGVNIWIAGLHSYKM